MEMIKGYESDSAFSEASETQEHTGTQMPEVNRQEINARAVRKVYLHAGGHYKRKSSLGRF